MTITRERPLRAEVEAVRALTLALAWQRLERVADPVRHAAELRAFAEEMQGSFPLRVAGEARTALSDMLDTLDGLARPITPISPA